MFELIAIHPYLSSVIALIILLPIIVIGWRALQWEDADAHYRKNVWKVKR